MPGPLAIGFVSQFFGLEVGFVVGGALGLAAIALLRLLVKAVNEYEIGEHFLKSCAFANCARTETGVMAYYRTRAELQKLF
jgi:hypothetical protein